MRKPTQDELKSAIDQIDQRTGTYVIFDVMTTQGPSKRAAFDYTTGKAIVEAWKGSIISYKLIKDTLK